MLKVFVFPTQNNGCGKYRAWSPAAALKKMGLCEIRRGLDVPEDITVGKVQEIFEWADVVYTQTFTGLWASTMFVSGRDSYKKKLIVDLDDSLWDTHPMNVGTVNDKLFKLNDHFSDDPSKFWEMHQMTQEQWDQYIQGMNDDDRTISNKPTFAGGTMLELDGKKVFVKQKNPDARSAANFYLSHADAVTTTNEFLAATIHRNTGQENIYLTPNCLSSQEWDGIPERQKRDEVWIGWSGSVSHYPDLKFLVPVLDRLMEKYPQLRIQIMGSSFDYLFPPTRNAQAYGVGGYGGMNNEAVYYKWEDAGERWPGRMRFDKPVKIQEYSQWMAKNWISDIGIAPLDVNDFNRCKSELKWCEYSMLGSPTVASKVGPYKAAIRHGVDGLVCGTARSWQNALERLIESPELRNDLARTARRRILDEYDADRQAHRWSNIFNEVAGMESGTIPVASEEGAHVHSL